MTTAPLPPRVQGMQQQNSQVEFNKSIVNNSREESSQNHQNDPATALMNLTSEHIYSTGTNGMMEPDPHNTSMPAIPFVKGKGPLPPPPPSIHQPMKPGWPLPPPVGSQQQNGMVKVPMSSSFSPSTNGNYGSKNDEDAIPNDSLYAGGHHQGQPTEANAPQKSGTRQSIT